MSKVTEHQLEQALSLILCAAGCDPSVASEVAMRLVEADACGHASHGSRQIDFYLERLARGEVDGAARTSLELDAGPILRVKGNRAFGQIAGVEAARRGTARAKELGVALVLLEGSGHLGRNGLWAEIAAAEGVGSLHFGQGLPGAGPVAPFGGTEGRLNTNPIAFGLPGTAFGASQPSNASDQGAIILDCATSALSGSAMKQLFDQGALLSEPLIVRPDGSPSTDPGDYVHGLGAILPFGGFKGYAVSVLSEILSSIIAANGKGEPATNSLFSIYFDIARLMDAEIYRISLAAWSARLTSCPPAKADQPVMLPGERSRAVRGQVFDLSAESASHVVKAAQLSGCAAELAQRFPQLVLLADAARMPLSVPKMKS